MLTVGLPMYRADLIGWLPLESLCRQKTDQEWELLIIEEKFRAFGLKNIMKYKKRLTDAGCININYNQVDKWIPLSQKYYIMAQEMKGDIFVLHASDDYSHPDRLQMTADNILDMYQQTRGYFYEISTERMIVLDWLMRPFKHPCCLNMAYKADFFKRIKNERHDTGNDGWIYKSANEDGGMRIFFDKSDVWERGLHTQGQNNISMGRMDYFLNPRGVFRGTKTKIQSVLPDVIVKRLHGIKDEETIMVRAGKYED